MADVSHTVLIVEGEGDWDRHINELVGREGERYRHGVW